MFHTRKYILKAFLTVFWIHQKSSANSAKPQARPNQLKWYSSRVTPVPQSYFAGGYSKYTPTSNFQRFFQEFEVFNDVPYFNVKRGS